MTYIDRRSAARNVGITPVFLLILHIFSVFFILTGCRETEPPIPAGSPPSKEMVYYGFAEDMPQSVLDTFTKEYGITVQYLPFQSPEEAEKHIIEGQGYDLALIENQLIPVLIKKHLLDEIDLAKIPNFKNISANFRDLVLDPGNRYSIPASYGTTGLVVRTDLVGDDLKRWADLWSPKYAGKIGLRAQPREVIGMTLNALGYPSDSENPQYLEEVLKKLLELKPSIIMLGIETDDAISRLLKGEIAILHGYAEDYHEAHDRIHAVAYVLPMEGTAVWAESYVIPVNGQHRGYSELLINFLLRPEITAQIINEKKYAQPNDAAFPLVSPEIHNDPVIFPGEDQLRNSFIIKPLSPAGQKLYNDIWARFIEERR